MKRLFLVLALVFGLLAPAAASSWQPSDTVVASQIISKRESGKLYAFWQSRDSNYNSAISVVTYQGPGDVVSGATAWGSCARAYSSGITAGTSMCDLVDSAAPTTVICTLQTGSNGLVNLAGTYCTGSVTPATKCAAATGGKCNISKIYDQAGSTGGWTQATAANQPTLVFSALNGLPSVNCDIGSTVVLATSGNVPASQPFTFSAVYEEVATGGGGIIGGAGVSDASLMAGNAVVGLGTTTLTFSGSASTNSFHAVQGASISGASSSVVNVDGTETTGTYSSTIGASTLRFCRNGSGGATLLGSIMEAGLWATVGFSGTQRTNMNTNQHGTNGYNF